MWFLYAACYHVTKGRLLLYRNPLGCRTRLSPFFSLLRLFTLEKRDEITALKMNCGHIVLFDTKPLLHRDKPRVDYILFYYVWQRLPESVTTPTPYIDPAVAIFAFTRSRRSNILGLRTVWNSNKKPLKDAESPKVRWSRLHINDNWFKLTQ